MTATYMIVSRYNIEDLEAEVERWIEKGWTPQGGLTVLNEEQYELEEYSVCFLQAMVKVKK